MKKIIITESQYKRLLTEKMVYKIDGDIDFKTGGWSKPPEDPDPDFRAKEYTLRSFNKYLSYFGDSNTIVDFE